MTDLKKLAELLIKAKERGAWNDIDHATMDYYDAASPAVILSLLDRVEKAEAALSSLAEPSEDALAAAHDAFVGTSMLRGYAEWCERIKAAMAVLISVRKESLPTVAQLDQQEKQ